MSVAARRTLPKIELENENRPNERTSIVYVRIERKFLLESTENSVIFRLSKDDRQVESTKSTDEKRLGRRQSSTIENLWAQRKILFGFVFSRRKNSAPRKTPIEETEEKFFFSLFIWRTANGNQFSSSRTNKSREKEVRSRRENFSLVEVRPSLENQQLFCFRSLDDRSSISVSPSFDFPSSQRNSTRFSTIGRSDSQRFWWN